MTLDEYLTRHGLTDRAFGALLGKTGATINRWRNGHRRPRRLEDYDALARVTNGHVTMSDFLRPGTNITSEESRRGESV